MIPQVPVTILSGCRGISPTLERVSFWAFWVTLRLSYDGVAKRPPRRVQVLDSIVPGPASAPFLTLPAMLRMQ